MFSLRFIGTISISLIILLLFPMNTTSQSKKPDPQVTQGKVFEISRTFITVGRTTIALPQKIKTLDINGSSISFEMIKKGDYVSVRLSKNEATIKKVLESRERSGEEAIPQ